jgi:endo-1,4-beta-xylanase
MPKVPINAVGLQGHWSIYEPSGKELEETIKLFSSLGLKVQITEMDVSVYPWEKNRRQKQPGEQDTLTAALEDAQAVQYGKLFDVLRKEHKYLTGVTFWNVSDRSTWLDNYPVPGRKNYPLLFDRNNQPKQAYWTVVKF